MSRPAVFLDRDGTLIEERGYLDRLELLSLFPWTGDAIRLLNRAGFATVVITNQAAVTFGPEFSIRFATPSPPAVS